MARYEFRFVVSDIELKPEQHEQISRAVAQAASLALAEVTPANAVTVPLGLNIWWRGIPPEVAFGQLEARARQEVQAER